jgi:hypothetical protein
MFRRRLLLAGGLLAACVGLLLPVVLCFLVLLSGNFSKLAAFVGQYQTNIQNGHQLDHEIEVMQWRLDNQNQLLRELVAGRISFLQTAACFQYLNENPPEDKPTPLPFPGSTAEQKTCRQVIHWVKGYMENHPEIRDEALLERLDQELAQLLARPQGVQFPAVAPETLARLSPAQSPLGPNPASASRPRGAGL